MTHYGVQNLTGEWRLNCSGTSYQEVVQKAASYAFDLLEDDATYDDVPLTYLSDADLLELIGWRVVPLTTSQHLNLSILSQNAMTNWASL